MRGTRSFDLALERDEKLHGAQRRLVARPYSMESMKRLEPHVDEIIELLCRRFDSLLQADQGVFDLGYWIQLYAFDVIGAVSFGKSFSFVENGIDNGMFARLEKAMNSAAWIMYAGWFFRFHQKVIMPSKLIASCDMRPKDPVG
jgi:cytochrome P450